MRARSGESLFRSGRSENSKERAKNCGVPERVQKRAIVHGKLSPEDAARLADVPVEMVEMTWKAFDLGIKPAPSMSCEGRKLRRIILWWRQHSARTISGIHGVSPNTVLSLSRYIGGVTEGLGDRYRDRLQWQGEFWGSRRGKVEGRGSRMASGIFA